SPRRDAATVGCSSARRVRRAAWHSTPCSCPASPRTCSPERSSRTPCCSTSGAGCSGPVRSSPTPSGWKPSGSRCPSPPAPGPARGRVGLSVPGVEVEKARRWVPSFYALEVLKAAEGRLPGLDALTRGAELAAGARLGWPAPAEPRDAIDEAEYDLALLA